MQSHRKNCDPTSLAAMSSYEYAHIVSKTESFQITHYTWRDWPISDSRRTLLDLHTI